MPAAGDKQTAFDRPLEFRLFTADGTEASGSEAKFAPGDSVTVAIRFVIAAAEGCTAEL